MFVYNFVKTHEETRQHTPRAHAQDMASVGVVEMDGVGGSASAPRADPNQATPVPAHPFGGGPEKVGGAGVANTKNTSGMWLYVVEVEADG